MLCRWRFLFNPWNWVAMASQWHETLCSILYPWKPFCIGQYMLFNGTCEATEENVWNNKIACNNYYAFVPGVYPVCCSLVAEERAGLTLLHIAVPVDDLVQSVLHPVCKGRCAQVLQLHLELKVTFAQEEWFGNSTDTVPAPEMAAVSARAVDCWASPCSPPFPAR